jgi:hypothetical protein
MPREPARASAPRHRPSMSAHDSQDIYASPPTFLEALLECAAFIEQQRHDPATSKNDVLDSMERRVSLLVGKLASHPTCSAFQIVPAPP